MRRERQEPGIDQGLVICDEDDTAVDRDPRGAADLHAVEAAEPLPEPDPLQELVQRRVAHDASNLSP